MQISNLSQNNYYTGNSRWVRVYDFAFAPERLKLKVKNLGTQKEVNLILYPINNEFNFDLSIAVRSLMNPVVLQNQNVINNFEFTFDVEFLDNIPNDILVLNKTFIKGFATQLNANKDYINDGEILYIREIVKYGNEIDFYLNQFLIFLEYQQFSNNAIIENEINLYQPTPINRNKDYCNYALVRFLNSKGGYQSFIFDSFFISTKNKPQKLIPTKIVNFNDAGFRTIGSEVTHEIELVSQSNQNENLILADMIHSNDIAWFDFNTEKWIQLIPNQNNVNLNVRKESFENKLKFDFYTTVNNSDVW